MKKRLTMVVLLLSVFSAASVLATPVVNINGVNYDSPNHSLTYDFIKPSNQSWDTGSNKINIVDYILDGRLGAGSHTYTLVNGATSSNPVESWFANGAVSVIINEIAGYANTNTFGYYTMDENNAPVRTELFSGPDNQTTEARAFTLSFPQVFGFYLGVPNANAVYYTQSGLNIQGEIHAAIFQVDHTNTFIIGFEDLRLTNTDADYQDMIVSITITPDSGGSVSVPEPATMLLLGLGLLGLARFRRKLQK